MEYDKHGPTKIKIWIIMSFPLVPYWIEGNWQKLYITFTHTLVPAPPPRGHDPNDKTELTGVISILQRLWDT